MPRKLTHQGGRALGRVCAYYVNFQFSHACIRPFCHKNYKRLQNVFNVVTNKDKTETQNALCNFSKSPHMCRSPGYIALVHYAACAFCPIYMACGLALVDEYSLSGCFIQSWLVWALRERRRESVSVFDGFVFISVDVKYIIHYKGICQFICSL